MTVASEDAQPRFVPPRMLRATGHLHIADWARPHGPFTRTGFAVLWAASS